MYVNNGKISSRQTLRLYIFDLMGIATLLLPPYLAKLSRIDGIAAIIIGTGLGFLYLFYLGWIMKQMKTDLCSYLKEQVNVFVRNLTYALVMFHCIFTAGFCAFVFADLMQYSLVKETSFFTLLVTIMIVAAYAVSGGIETRARVYEILFWFVLIPYVAMMLATVKNFEPVYFNEILTTSGENLAKAIYFVFLFLTPLFFVLFLIGEKEKCHGKSVVKTVAISIGVSAIILLGSYVLLIGNFGANALAAMRYPVVTIMSTIQFKGNFVKRMDALMLAVWFFTLYALLNLHLHYGVSMLQEMCHKTKKESKFSLGMLIVPSVLVFAVAYGMKKSSRLMFLFFDYYSYIAVPLMILGPGILLLVRRKEYGNKKSVAKMLRDDR